MVAVAPVAGADATSTVDTLMARLGDQALAPGDVFLVGRSAEHTTVLADQLRAASTMRVQTPDDPTFALARGAAMAAGAATMAHPALVADATTSLPRPRRGNRVLKASSWRTRRPAITSCFRSTNMRNTTNTGQPRIARRR
ncbi:membrane protein [Mycobacterium tuberculosis]|nr:membrane protein [Mycobacterium tuberculosis]